ncbi:MAG: methyltransferase domain-containing protein, partial [Oscillospiraceae bacterium]|nr:methyltransferase domain-containing protein [Oscillospiraceae bacterium]
MRMRKKPNLIPRMERCANLLVTEPESMRGHWLEGTSYRHLYLEIGCGKGSFTAKTAATLPDVLYVAVERVPDAMVVAMERCSEEGLSNVRFIDIDAGKLCDLFAPGEADRIYINFCDPWPSRRHEKRRLTAPGFLYRPSAAPALRFDYVLRLVPVLMVCRAVCSTPWNVFTVS